MMVNVNPQSIRDAQSVLKKTAMAINNACEKLLSARQSLQSSGKDRQSAVLLSEVEEKLSVLRKVMTQLRHDDNSLSLLYAAICEYIKDNG